MKLCKMDPVERIDLFIKGFPSVFGRTGTNEKIANSIWDKLKPQNNSQNYNFDRPKILHINSAVGNNVNSQTVAFRILQLLGTHWVGDINYVGDGWHRRPNQITGFVKRKCNHDINKAGAFMVPFHELNNDDLLEFDTLLDEKKTPHKNTFFIFYYHVGPNTLKKPDNFKQEIMKRFDKLNKDLNSPLIKHMFPSGMNDDSIIHL